MRLSFLELAMFAALALSQSAQAVEGYVGVGITQVPGGRDFRLGNGLVVSGETQSFSRFFGGIWINESFAIEGAHHDFGRRTLPAIADFGYDLESEGWSLGVVYEYGDAAWAPYTKIGYFTADIDGEFTTIAGSQQVSRSDNGLMLEGGVRWTPTDTFSLRGGYEWFDFEGGGDIGLTIGAQISF